MKRTYERTYERILFMAIGAIISFCAYFIGCMSQTQNIQAQETEKVIRCDKLIVNDQILVGGGPGGIVLSNNKDKGITGLQIRHGIGEDNSSSITISTDSDNSSILLKDSKGTKELNTTNIGRYEQLYVNDILLIGDQTGDHCAISGASIMISSGSSENPDSNISIGATENMATIGLQTGNTKGKEQMIVLMTHRDRKNSAVVLKDIFGMKTIVTTDADNRQR